MIQPKIQSFASSTPICRGAIGSDTDRILSLPYPYPTQPSDTDTDTDIDGCEKMISVSAKIGYQI